MVCRKNFEVATLASGQKQTFKHIIWNIQVKSLSITGIYHPPSKDRVTNSMFIDDIMDHLTSFLPTTQKQITLGDFNIHVENV